jgi:hypothetical protein
MDASSTSLCQPTCRQAGLTTLFVTGLAVAIIGSLALSHIETLANVGNLGGIVMLTLGSIAFLSAFIISCFPKGKAQYQSIPSTPHSKTKKTVTQTPNTHLAAQIGVDPETLKQLSIKTVIVKGKETLVGFFKEKLWVINEAPEKIFKDKESMQAHFPCDKLIGHSFLAKPSGEGHGKEKLYIIEIDQEGQLSYYTPEDPAFFKIFENSTITLIKPDA